MTSAAKWVILLGVCIFFVHGIETDGLTHSENHESLTTENQLTVRALRTPRKACKTDKGCERACQADGYKYGECNNQRCSCKGYSGSPKRQLSGSSSPQRKRLTPSRSRTPPRTSRSPSRSSRSPSRSSYRSPSRSPYRSPQRISSPSRRRLTSPRSGRYSPVRRGRTSPQRRRSPTPPSQRRKASRSPPRKVKSPPRKVKSPPRKVKSPERRGGRSDGSRSKESRKEDYRDDRTYRSSSPRPAPAPADVLTFDYPPDGQPPKVTYSQRPAGGSSPTNLYQQGVNPYQQRVNPYQQGVQGSRPVNPYQQGAKGSRPAANTQEGFEEDSSESTASTKDPFSQKSPQGSMPTNFNQQKAKGPQPTIPSLQGGRGARPAAGMVEEFGEDGLEDMAATKDILSQKQPQGSIPTNFNQQKAKGPQPTNPALQGAKGTQPAANMDKQLGEDSMEEMAFAQQKAKGSRQGAKPTNLEEDDDGDELENMGNGLEEMEDLPTAKAGQKAAGKFGEIKEKEPDLQFAQKTAPPPVKGKSPAGQNSGLPSVEEFENEIAKAKGKQNPLPPKPKDRADEDLSDEDEEGMFGGKMDGGLGKKLAAGKSAAAEFSAEDGEDDLMGKGGSDRKPTASKQSAADFASKSGDDDFMGKVNSKVQKDGKSMDGLLDGEELDDLDGLPGGKKGSLSGFADEDSMEDFPGKMSPDMPPGKKPTSGPSDRQNGKPPGASNPRDFDDIDDFDSLGVNRASAAKKGGPMDYDPEDDELDMMNGGGKSTSSFGNNNRFAGEDLDFKSKMGQEPSKEPAAASGKKQLPPVKNGKAAGDDTGGKGTPEKQAPTSMKKPNASSPSSIDEDFLEGIGVASKKSDSNTSDFDKKDTGAASKKQITDRKSSPLADYEDEDTDFLRPKQPGSLAGKKLPPKSSIDADLDDDDMEDLVAAAKKSAAGSKRTPSGFPGLEDDDEVDDFAGTSAKTPGNAAKLSKPQQDGAENAAESAVSKSGNVQNKAASKPKSLSALPDLEDESNYDDLDSDYSQEMLKPTSGTRGKGVKP
nr:PREDICTED: serine/arginine repetitive matrix protein 2-like [Bemisia tabaci]